MTAESYVRSTTVMGTIATIEVVGPDSAETAVDSAFEWFRQIEACCSRFDTGSELSQLSSKIGTAVPISAVLFEAVQFAIAVADETDGAFDPTVGSRMETAGFNREYRSGLPVHTGLEADDSVTYRDVLLDPVLKTITLLKPMVLDLGAVAKGLAVDMAARELLRFKNFAIDAGGDLYLGGCNSEGSAWSVGICHPRTEGELIASIRVSNQAVCTSGDYERGDHILDPREGHAARDTASVTVVAQTAMLADALATAAFVLGPAEGIQLLEKAGVGGLIITPALERFETQGMRHG